jgi:hypothetical protein
MTDDVLNEERGRNNPPQQADFWHEKAFPSGGVHGPIFVFVITALAGYYKLDF